jgi:hypothetical protein
MEFNYDNVDLAHFLMNQFLSDCSITNQNTNKEYK